MNLSAWVYAYLYPTCWNWPQNGWNSWNCMEVCENCMKVYERCVWECVKVSPLNFWAPVHAFWYQICWNLPKNDWNCMKLHENCVKLHEGVHKEFLSWNICILILNCWRWPINGWNSQNCVKLCENCIKLCEGGQENVWKYHHWISQLEYMQIDTKPVEIGPKMAKIAKIVWNCVKIAWNCRKECVKLRETQNTAYPCWAGSNDTSNSPNGRNMAEKSAWMETHTDRHTHTSVLYIRQLFSTIWPTWESNIGGLDKTIPNKIFKEIIGTLGRSIAGAYIFPQ